METSESTGSHSETMRPQIQFAEAKARQAEAALYAVRRTCSGLGKGRRSSKSTAPR